MVSRLTSGSMASWSDDYFRALAQIPAEKWEPTTSSGMQEKEWNPNSLPLPSHPGLDNDGIGSGLDPATLPDHWNSGLNPGVYSSQSVNCNASDIRQIQGLNCNALTTFQNVATIPEFRKERMNQFWVTSMNTSQENPHLSSSSYTSPDYWPHSLNPRTVPENWNKDFDASDEQSKSNDPPRIRSRRSSRSSIKSSVSSTCFKTPRFKTKPCLNFTAKMVCPYGQVCKYAHGEAEIEPSENRSKYKTKICNQYWKRGYCIYGPRCNFVHNENPAMTNTALARGFISNIPMSKQVQDYQSLLLRASHLTI